MTYFENFIYTNTDAGSEQFYYYSVTVWEDRLLPQKEHWKKKQFKDTTRNDKRL